MQSPEPFLVFTSRLNALGMPYMVSGSVAAIFYGEPRLTNDVDLILHIRADEVARLTSAFPQSEFYCPPVEVILLEIAREQRGHFNLIDHATGFKADIYLAGQDELHAWGLDNISEVSLGEERIRLAPPEYVIVRKLQFFREGRSNKHLRDIHRMLQGLGPGWNRDRLHDWLQRCGLQGEYDAAVQFEG